MDISKPGILLASKSDKKSTWIVGDISNMPIRDNSVDVIINTLSPANYQEFERVLKDDGIVIMTVPNEQFLKELCQVASKRNYSNSDTVKRLKLNLNSINEIRV